MVREYSDYIPSRYNIALSDENSFVIFNSVSNEFIKACSKEQHDYLVNYNGIRSDNIFSEEQITDLARKGILVNSNIDEAHVVMGKYYEQIYDGRTLEITLIPTDACNLRCEYCYETNGNHFMEDSTVEMVVDHISRKLHQYKCFRLNWFGGEPLVNSKLVVSLSDRLYKLCRKHRVAFYGSITTNGYLLSEEIVKSLLSVGIRTFQVTVDGTEKIHNVSRPHKVNDDSYSRIISNLVNMSKSDYRFHVAYRMNLSKQIIRNFEECIGVFEKYFAQDPRFSVLLQPVSNWGGDRIDQNYEYIDMMEWLECEEIIRKKKLRLFDNFEIPLKFKPCEASCKHAYYINYDGSILKCTLPLYDKNTSNREVNQIGHLNNLRNDCIDRGNEFQWLSPTLNNKKCNSCKLLPICINTFCPYKTKFTKTAPCYFEEFMEIIKRKSIGYID